MKGANELRALLGQRTWDKEVVLWLGFEKSLFDVLAATKHVVLDLLDLFDVNNLPVDDDETRTALRERLRQRLRAIPKGPENRAVLVVKSISLLARYEVGRWRSRNGTGVCSREVTHLAAGDFLSVEEAGLRRMKNPLPYLDSRWPFP